MLAMVLVATGYWPPQVPFEMKEALTVIDELEKRNKANSRGR